MEIALDRGVGRRDVRRHGRQADERLGGERLGRGHEQHVDGGSGHCDEPEEDGEAHQEDFSRSSLFPPTSLSERLDESDREIRLLGFSGGGRGKQREGGKPGDGMEDTEGAEGAEGAEALVVSCERAAERLLADFDALDDDGADFVERARSCLRRAAALVGTLEAVRRDALRDSKVAHDDRVARAIARGDLRAACQSHDDEPVQRLSDRIDATLLCLFDHSYISATHDAYYLRRLIAEDALREPRIPREPDFQVCSTIHRAIGQAGPVSLLSNDEYTDVVLCFPRRICTPFCLFVSPAFPDASSDFLWLPSFRKLRILGCELRSSSLLLMPLCGQHPPESVTASERSKVGLLPHSHSLMMGVLRHDSNLSLAKQAGNITSFMMMHLKNIYESIAGPETYSNKDILQQIEKNMLHVCQREHLVRLGRHAMRGQRTSRVPTRAALSQHAQTQDRVVSLTKLCTMSVSEESCLVLWKTTGHYQWYAGTARAPVADSAGEMVARFHPPTWDKSTATASTASYSIEYAASNERTDVPCVRPDMLLCFKPAATEREIHEKGWMTSNTVSNATAEATSAA